MCEFELLHKPVFKMNDGACIATFFYGHEDASLGTSVPVLMLHGNGESYENEASERVIQEAAVAIEEAEQNV